jgi:hypothetical protein
MKMLMYNLEGKSILMSLSECATGFKNAVGLDIRLNYRRYLDWVQNALSWMEVYLLHAKKTGI